MSYQTAYEELQGIVQAMQENTIGIDDLPSTLERASLLIRFCREHLRQTEDKIQNFLEEEV